LDIYSDITKYVQRQLYHCLFIISQLLAHVVGFSNLSFLFWGIYALGCLPIASAHSDHMAFPDIPFQVFSQFIQEQFSSQISLPTVLTILFSMTNNPDLLTLHSRQQHPKMGEKSQKNSGWIKALAHALENRLGSATCTLFHKAEQLSELSSEKVTSSIGIKLDGLSKILDLHPYNEAGKFLGKLKPILEEDIEPVHIICPITMDCEISTCQSRAILKHTRGRDTSKATLIKGTRIFHNVPVLYGQCPKCKTSYSADYERPCKAENTWMKIYLNSAKFLKVGKNIWVDRVFSSAVLNATYNFHASSTAYAEFWNASFWSTQKTLSKKVSRRQVWQAFIQESVRRVASVSDFNLEVPDKLSINELAKQAFNILGESGIVRSADGHACSECTHEYKHKADQIPASDDPAGLIGIDENRQVPAFVGENNDDPVNVDTSGQDSEGELMQVDDENPSSMSIDQHTDVTMKQSYVNMIVIDGIVMGPKHCAYVNCTEDLANYRNGVFCVEHEKIRGKLCHVQTCQNSKADGIQTCHQHRNLWHSHVVRFGRSTMLGIWRLLRRSEEEKLPWLPVSIRNVQPHDEPAQPSATRSQTKTYFVAPHWYCVEIATTTCGLPLAWEKFAKAESPTNILNFLDRVYPTEESRPDYVCIDKACLVLRHAVTSGRWDAWKKTTRFIVDSYHYINHRTTDYLCRKYCNPAPLNGSAPNLVAVEQDKNGRPHFKRAFNTQVYTFC
jgi:CxC5 like cysteine cluster associated with KDZ transposases/CxC6 like cysteine cluster associated with KDZ transposases